MKATLSLVHVCLGVALLGLLGCAAGYKVKVDSLTKPQPVVENAVAYRIKPSPRLDPDSLRVKEAEKFVRTALSGRGLYEAPQPEQADIVVNLDYGVSEPKVNKERRSEPIYQTIPGRIRSVMVQVGTDKNGNPIYAMQTYQEPPTTEYVGEREYIVTIITYEKYMRLSARENKPASDAQPPAELWTVDVSSEGESSDLRKHLPVLAAATIEFIGVDTRGQKSIRLKDEKDSAIAFVKKGL